MICVKRNRVIFDLLWNICEDIDFTTQKQKHLMNQIIGIFEN